MFRFDWFDANADTLVSVVSAFAAILAVWVTVWAQRENTAPNIIVYLEHGIGSTIKLTMRNIGHGVAYDIKIDGFEPGMMQGEEVDSPYNAFAGWSLVMNGVPMLAPGCSREKTASVSINVNKSILQQSWHVTVSWSLKPGSRRRYKAGCILEYASFY